LKQKEVENALAESTFTAQICALRSRPSNCFVLHKKNTPGLYFSASSANILARCCISIELFLAKKIAEAFDENQTPNPTTKRLFRLNAMAKQAGRITYSRSCWLHNPGIPAPSIFLGHGRSF